jgi:prepilin-type N-terminal cleavage/methylation domain-containing protein
MTQRGYTLVELLVALAMATLLMAGLAGVTGNALQIGEAARERLELNRQARFAMDRIVRMVSRSPGLVLPLADNPATVQVESIHTALAILLPRDIDLDGNGIADADNDGDGRFDEDLPSDMNKDGAPGIAGIDDNLDGVVDNGASGDDDESGSADEDKCDGVDNDGDGSIDEDCGADMNADALPGLADVDDDGDGSIDEGGSGDDDEDGRVDEDWLDTVVFYLQGGVLKERMPVPWDANGSGTVTGADTVTSALAENVTLFRVERLPRDNGRAQEVEITLELTGAGGAKVSLKTRVRVGGSL